MNKFESKPPVGGYLQGLDVIGYSDVAGRPAFKMSVRKIAVWYLYTEHFSTLPPVPPVGGKVETLLKSGLRTMTRTAQCQKEAPMPM